MPKLIFVLMLAARFAAAQTSSPHENPYTELMSWIDDDAHPHSESMHVVERWSRPDYDHLAHEVWVEDPKYYTKPWTFQRVFTLMPPGQELYEMACDENNLDRDGGHLGFGPLDLKNYPLEPKIAPKNESPKN